MTELHAIPGLQQLWDGLLKEGETVTIQTGVQDGDKVIQGYLVIKLDRITDSEPTKRDDVAKIVITFESEE